MHTNTKAFSKKHTHYLLPNRKKKKKINIFKSMSTTASPSQTSSLQNLSKPSSFEDVCPKLSSNSEAKKTIHNPLIPIQDLYEFSFGKAFENRESKEEEFKTDALENDSKNSSSESPFLRNQLLGSIISHERASSCISDDTDATKHYQKRSILKTSNSWVNLQKMSEGVERKDKFGNGIQSGGKKHKVSFNRNDLKPERAKKPQQYYLQNRSTAPICCTNYNLCNIF